MRSPHNNLFVLYPEVFEKPKKNPAANPPEEGKLVVMILLKFFQAVIASLESSYKIFKEN